MSIGGVQKKQLKKDRKRNYEGYQNRVVLNKHIKNLNQCCIKYKKDTCCLRHKISLKLKIKE